MAVRIVDDIGVIPGNLTVTGTLSTVNGTSQQWATAVTNIQTISGDYATRAFTDAKYLALSGGTVVGNLGVGTFQPNTKLTVVGNISATGNISGNVLATGTLSARTLENRFADVINVKDFGAKGDGVTDDTAAIQAAIDIVFTKGGGSVLFPIGRYLIDSANLTIKKNVFLTTDTPTLGEVPSADYSNIKTAIILNPLYTIHLADDFTGLHGFAILKKGLTAPTTRAQAETLIASFSGTAITVGNGTFGAASDTFVSHCLVLGFEQAYLNNKSERANIQYLRGDCTNGILLQNQYDINRIQNCQFWPFLTARVETGGPNNRALTYRSGVAYKFETTGNENYDWPVLESCFEFGYKIGFHFIGVSTVTMFNCQTDGYSYTDYTNSTTYVDNRHITTGVKFESRLRPDGNIVGRLLTIIGSLFAGQNKGLVIDTATGYFPTITITGTNFVSNITNHIDLIRGRLNFASGTLKDVEIGPAINVSLSANGVNISSAVDFEQIDNLIGGTVAPISLPGSQLYLSNIDNPNFVTGITNIFVNNLGEVHNSLDDLARITYTKIRNNADSYEYWFQKARGLTTLATNTTVLTSITLSAVQNNDQLGKITFLGHDGNQFVPSAYILAKVSAVPGSNSIPTALTFATSITGVANDCLAVTPSGFFVPVTDNAYQLGQTGNRWSAIWAANGTIQTSDQRDKTDIQPTSLGLNFINQLNPVSYKWVVGENKIIAPTESGIPLTEPIPGQRTHHGLLAQEVKAALPEGVDFGGWVLTDKNDPNSQQALRYDQFIAPLIKAVQELTTRVQTLESQLTSQ